MSTEKHDDVRVRFAPSPTGYLHVGGARTAIFNWLYAKQRQGKFLLRIEDTDEARSDEKMVAAIYDGLKWLGIDWDEAPVFQSQRVDLYQKICQSLIDSGHAYFCYCTREELAARNHDAFQYDGHCRNLSEEEVERREKQKIPRVIRFKVEPGETFFRDVILGSLTFDNNEIDDFIILRSDLKPTYHLAVVVDDFNMGITHIIRGNDHLTNTPKQVLIYRALNWKLPKFAHVPLILGPDKKRLSKRHGATSVSDYKNEGYLPDAMFNFLALLGWSPKGNQEILSQEEMIAKFSLKGISKNSAIFDETKLNWMNGRYISQMSDEDIYQAVKPMMEKFDFISSRQHDKNYLLKVISMLKTRVKNLNDFFVLGYYFFKDPEQYDEKVVEKHWHGNEVVKRLEWVHDDLAELESFQVKEIERTIRELAEKNQAGAGTFIHPIRLAITGYGVSPGLFEIMETLGKETVLRRISKAIDWLKQRKE